jgi:peptidoglycan hydrolase-like protein with peptidoglycan-binding domain
MRPNECARLTSMAFVVLGVIGTLMPAAASANTDPNTPWIMYDGQTGPGVDCIQIILLACTGHSQVELDGIFGPVTRQGVYDMQRFFGLQQDGIVGPETGEAFKVVGQNCFVPLVGRVWESYGCQAAVPTKT